MSDYNFQIDNYSTKVRSKLKINLEAARDLMDSLNFSGVFSEKLIGKFWMVIYNTLEVIIEKDINKNKSLKNYDFSENIKEFKAIYEPYCIFSEEFKISLWTKYLTVLHQPK